MIGLIHFCYIDGSFKKTILIYRLNVVGSTVLVFGVWLLKNQADIHLLDKLLGSVEYQHSTMSQAIIDRKQWKRINKNKMRIGVSVVRWQHARMLKSYELRCECVCVRYSVECKNEQSIMTDHTYIYRRQYTYIGMSIDVSIFWHCICVSLMVCTM